MRCAAWSGFCLALVGVLVVAAPAWAEEAAPPAPESEPAQPAEQAADGPAWDANVKLPSFLDTTDRRIVDDRPPPTQQEVRALRELEAELDRFSRMGEVYRQTMGALLQREYRRQRRDRERTYGGQIDVEEKLEDQARLSAIELFERFIEKYPDDPTYTPDAMFRLGELYFERDAIAQQREANDYLTERDRRLDTGESMDGLDEPSKDFSATIGLYKRIAENFPDYDKLDGAFYLIGYCHNEMGQTELARVAWLNLVCGNRFQYTAYEPEAEKEQSEEEAERAELEKEHPSLTMDGKGAPDQPSPFDDPFADCQPIAQNSKFWAESWLRIGEYHFDFDFTPHGLDKAVSAYSKVLERKDDRNFNLALYKVAWTYYRASRYPEAIEHFWKLVDWSDEERKRTGKGSELREEAIQYLAIAFAYDDWNENQITDPNEGLPTGFERVQNATLMPQDRPWTSEIYFRLGYVFFDEAKYPEAVQVWRLALSRWPLDPQAPEVQNMVAAAHVRHNEQAEAIAARAKLSNFGEGSTWWEANKDHPKEQRRAEQLAQDALINTALIHHQRAQRVRRECVEQQDPELCKQAQEDYGLAALAYRGYIKRFPNNPQAYELNYNLADALYWSESYEEAGREYAAVRDSNLDDRFLSISARLAVESVHRLVEQKKASGEIQVRTEPPAASGTPPRVQPQKLPPLLQQLARARELYLARVSDEQDTEKVRGAYFYNNTLLLYLYGYWDVARDRFYSEFVEHCAGPKADPSGQVAWLNLRNMAVSLGQDEEVRRLGDELRDRQCTFSPDGTAIAKVDCKKPENKESPACVAGSDLTNLRYRDAVEIFKRAEAAKDEEARKLYEAAATELVKAVNEEPNHEQAPLALEKAAIALERTSRFESAGRLYQRIIDEVGPKKGETPEQQAALDAILGNAYFRLGYNSNRFFDFDRAVDNYRTLADSPRFKDSKEPRMVEWREGSLINAAKILEYQQQYARAAEYYERAAGMLKDKNEQRVARYRVAEMAFKLKQWNKAITEMRAFIAQYRNDSDAGELLVQAQYRIAESRQNQGNQGEYKKALADVVSTYQRSGQKPGSYAAEYAAQAKFKLVDEKSGDFENFAIKSGSPSTLDAYVKGVTRQIEDGSREAKGKAEAYNVIPPFKRPTWTIAAFVKQGRIYEVLARAVLNTPFVVPADMKKKMRGLPDYAKDDIKIQVEDAIRQVLDAKVRPIECLAVARYALASRAARVGNIDDEYTREASDRINAYGDERIAECVAQAAAQDSTFQAYQPGEFSRAPRGQTLELEAGIAPPPLSRGR
ncbi:MAG: tetratricopeptide repeat protein [Myxococcales bacterium]|nr:tetratricopeptide repeat protein [Myxococcales bacterium]